MVQAKGEERAVVLAREAVELVDAGHREVCTVQNFFYLPALERALLMRSVSYRQHRETSEKPSP